MTGETPRRFRWRTSLWALGAVAAVTPPAIAAALTPVVPGWPFEVFGRVCAALFFEGVAAVAAYLLYCHVTADAAARKAVRFRHPDQVPRGTKPATTHSRTLRRARDRGLPNLRRSGADGQEMVRRLTAALRWGMLPVGVVVGYFSCGLLMLPFLAWAGHLQRRSRHRCAMFTAPTAAMARAADRRPPVLLLRSFADDRIAVAASLLAADTFEEVVEACLARYGPVIAVGEPGEEAPPTGASRTYLPHESWRQTVARLIGEARLVVLIAGTSSGFGWELREVVRRDVLDKTLILFPPAKLWDIDRRWRLVAAGLAERIAGPALGCGAGDVVAIAFADRTPVVIDGADRTGEEYVVAIDLATAVSDAAAPASPIFDDDPRVTQAFSQAPAGG